MTVSIRRSEDEFFLKTDGGWSEVRNEGKAFSEGLNGHKFSTMHGISAPRINVRAGEDRNGGVMPVSRRGRRSLVGASLQVKLICSPGDRDGEMILPLACFPGMGETIDDGKGRRFLIVGIMAVGNGQYDAVLFVRRQHGSIDRGAMEQADVAHNKAQTNIAELKSVASKPQVRNT